MVKRQAPVVLELAPLPREQIGPFLLLGVEKSADDEQVEASWAQRVIWARKQQLKVALEDVNWAREILRDPERRLRADLASLNPDTIEGVLARLCERYGASDTAGPAWQPLDAEKPLADYASAVDVPDPEQVRSAVPVPAAPAEVPAADLLLEQFVRQPLDAWALDLPPDGKQDDAA